MGWGVKDIVDYWELLNSWGPDWGNGGYFRMEKGVDACEIETFGWVSARVEKAQGYWQYEGPGTCGSGTQAHTIRCMSVDRTVASSNEACLDHEHVLRNYAGFDDEHLGYKSLPCEEVLSCGRSYCSGNGEATGNTTKSCVCACDAKFSARTCDE